MSSAGPVRHPLDATLGRIAEDLDRHLSALLEEWQATTEARVRAAIDETRQAGEAEVERRIQEAMVVAQEQAAEALAAVQSTERSVRDDERKADRARLEQLLTSMSHLDGSSTLRGALDALADAVALETPRGMVLVVRGQELRGWRGHGFPEAQNSSGMTFPIASAAPLAAAIERRVTVSMEGGQREWPLPFQPGEAAGIGLVIPVVLDSTVVALVYADSGNPAEGGAVSGRLETLQILVRYAGRRLEALTALRAAEEWGLGVDLVVKSE